jgi:hypothetical protein
MKDMRSSRGRRKEKVVALNKKDLSSKMSIKSSAEDPIISFQP